MNTIKFDLNDIVLVPKAQSEINSRSECNPYITFENNQNFLPLMAAPMDTVVSNENYLLFINNGIIPCIPRGQYNCNKYYSQFQSFSLCDIEKSLYGTMSERNNSIFKHFSYILIDIANGNMKRIVDILKDIKTHYPTTIIMVGNIANPETYVILAQAGAQYVRCSVGTGAGCTTAANVAVNYPMGSLINECYQLKKQYDLNTKIVADGGMRNYSDIIKALALGCFLPNTIVYTRNGFKKIQNININDYVYTHTGEYKKVICRFKYKNTKDIIAINEIYSTNNHNYYVINKIFKNVVTEKNIHQYAEWITAENLDSNYLLIEKNINYQHRMQMFLKNLFFKVFIIYKKIKKELYEKKTNKPIN